MPHFIDTNIFMYAVGSDHPCKKPSQSLLDKISAGEISAVVNTEVLQEVLYRYQTIGKSKIGYAIFDVIVKTIAEIWPVTREDALLARKMMEKNHLKSRDAIHVATMIRNKVKHIYTFDKEFDSAPKVKRLTP